MNKVTILIDDLRQYEKELKAWLDVAPSNNVYRQRYIEEHRWVCDQIQKYELAEAERKARRNDTVLRIAGTAAIATGSVLISNSDLGARWISSTKGPFGSVSKLF